MYSGATMIAQGPRFICKAGTSIFILGDIPPVMRFVSVDIIYVSAQWWVATHSVVGWGASVAEWAKALLS